MAEALLHCHKHMGDHATILHEEDGLPNWIKKHLKLQRIEAQGTWECHPAPNFYGGEAEKVVAVTVGDHIMELITRAKTNLSVILVGTNFKYEETKEYFQQAADHGLVEIFQLSGKVDDDGEVLVKGIVNEYDDNIINPVPHPFFSALCITLLLYLAALAVLGLPCFPALDITG